MEGLSDNCENEETLLRHDSVKGEDVEVDDGFNVDNRLYIAVLLPWEETKEIVADACRNCLVAADLP
jgi:hypothetical protein